MTKKNEESGAWEFLKALVSLPLVLVVVGINYVVSLIFDDL